MIEGFRFTGIQDSETTAIYTEVASILGNKDDVLPELTPMWRQEVSDLDHGRKIFWRLKFLEKGGINYES